MAFLQMKDNGRHAIQYLEMALLMAALGPSRAIASKSDPCKFLRVSAVAVIPAKAGIQFWRR
jgi:hypothetical protein